MLLHIRTNLDLYYRLFFVALFLLFGLSALATVILENYAGISIIPLQSEMEKQALLSVLGVMGVLAICVSLLIVYFMREKRRKDRRQESTATSLHDRRIIEDRRKPQH